MLVVVCWLIVGRRSDKQVPEDEQLNTALLHQWLVCSGPQGNLKISAVTALMTSCRPAARSLRTSGGQRTHDLNDKHSKHTHTDSGARPSQRQERRRWWGKRYRDNLLSCSSWRYWRAAPRGASFWIWRPQEAEAKAVCVTVRCLNDPDCRRAKPSVLIRVSVTYILSCVDWRVVGPLTELISLEGICSKWSKELK